MLTRKGLSRRLRNLGVDSEISKEISLKWELQVKSRGHEGAIDYLKRVGDTILWYLTSSGEKPDWVKVDNDGFPVFCSGLKGYPVETLVRVAKIARTIVLDEPSDRQIGKVLPAVVTPFNGDPAMVALVCQKLGGLAKGLFDGDLRKFYSPHFPLILQQWHKVMSRSGKTPVVAEPPLVDSLSLLKRQDVMTVVEAIPNWESAFYPITPKSLSEMIRVTKGSSNGCVGEIHASQEGAGKLRMFAAPYTVFQSLLTPLYDFIRGVRNKLGTDCTMHQEKGALFAQECLRAGLKVHSVDLSTATCRFPLDPQLAVLEGLCVPKEHIDFLKFVCRGKWEVDRGLQPYFESETIRWQVGQPLGIRPSIALFSLTHNLLLTWLCHRHGVKPMDTFRILGDDVVIANDDVHSSYREVITQMGIPISESKSHSSTSYAEFAGYSIFQDQMVRPGQWRELGFTNVKELASQLTSPTVSEGSPILLKIIKLIRFMSEDFTPPTTLLSKYETAAQILGDSKKSLCDMFRSEAPLWCVKVQEYVRGKYPLVNDQRKLSFYQMRFPTASRLLRRLGPVPDWLVNYAFHMDEFQVDNGDPIVFQGYLLSMAIIVASEASADEIFPSIDEVVQIISENTNAELWQPPAKRRLSVSTDLKRIIGALRSSGLAS
jgi:hypothetical protein